MKRERTLRELLKANYEDMCIARIMDGFGIARNPGNYLALRSEIRHYFDRRHAAAGKKERK